MPTNKSKNKITEDASLRQRLRKHMAAVAYAEAGEFTSARKIIEGNKAKTVLLVIEGERPTQAAFQYALNLCRRTGAELDILQVICKNESNDNYDALSHRMSAGSRRLVDMMQQLESAGIAFKITMRIGEVEQKLFNYAKRHKDVGMVVFDSPRSKTSIKKDPTWRNLIDQISKQLSIPLITVADA
jgi:hypothetical protein